MWKRNSNAEESGHGPVWPSRLGRVKTKKQRKQGIDVLEDIGEDQLVTKGKYDTCLARAVQLFIAFPLFHELK